MIGRLRDPVYGVYRRAEGEPASNAPVFFLSRSDTHENVDRKYLSLYEERRDRAGTPARDATGADNTLPQTSYVI